MPLIIICGTPVSGKTSRARELKEFFEKTHKKHVEIVSEDEAIVKLGYDKNGTYLDSQKEKRLRGYLKSEVIRLIGKDNVVILDGSNYIKGLLSINLGV
jgi:protein KTI12